MSRVFSVFFEIFLAASQAGLRDAAAFSGGAIQYLNVRHLSRTILKNPPAFLPEDFLAVLAVI